MYPYITTCTVSFTQILSDLTPLTARHYYSFTSSVFQPDFFSFFLLNSQFLPWNVLEHGLTIRLNWVRLPATIIAAVGYSAAYCKLCPICTLHICPEVSRFDHSVSRTLESLVWQQRLWQEVDLHLQQVRTLLCHPLSPPPPLLKESQTQRGRV